MKDPILYVDVSDIRPGSLPAVEDLMTDLVAFAEEEEPQLLTYDFFIDDRSGTMTCVALHPDPASIERHMDVGWERFRAFSEHIDQRSIDLYGEPGEAVIQRLEAKIEMLGRGRVTVHRRQAGFVRLAPGAP